MKYRTPYATLNATTTFRYQLRNAESAFIRIVEKSVENESDTKSRARKTALNNSNRNNGTYEKYNIHNEREFCREKLIK